MALTPENKHHVDAIVTLGLQLEDDGTPPPMLLERVAAAVRRRNALILAGQPAPLLIMSGNRCGSAVHIPPFTESAVMANHGVSLGTPRSAIREEKRSMDTFGNALFTKALLLELGCLSIEICTQRYHMEPALTAFDHVLGSDFEISGIVAGDGLITPEQALYIEHTQASRLAIINSTIPGDDAGMAALLRRTMPAYEEVLGETGVVIPFPRAVPEPLPVSLAHAA